jgi:hypothetical protein
MEPSLPADMPRSHMIIDWVLLLIVRSATWVTSRASSPPNQHFDQRSRLKNYSQLSHWLLFQAPSPDIDPREEGYSFMYISVKAGKTSFSIIVRSRPLDHSTTVDPR